MTDAESLACAVAHALAAFALTWLRDNGGPPPGVWVFSYIGGSAEVTFKEA